MTKSYRHWFNTFVAFNFIFFACQIGFILSQSGSFIHSLTLPSTTYIELFLTLGIHIGLYLLLSLLQTSLLWGVCQHHPRHSSIEYWHLGIWIISVVAIVVLNLYFFPLSAFSRLFLPELPNVIVVTLMLLSSLSLAILVLNSLFMTSHKNQAVVFIVLFSSWIGFFASPTSMVTKPKNYPGPNIFIIGVDSLSPERVTAKDTPNLAHFLQKSVVFTDTISPLAHTFPAWSSILTGLYPAHHGARYNLISGDLVKSRKSILWPLHKLGYQPIYATDDRRFNNIGTEFGFQKIVGTKAGANDFLLGTFNDFPLSNLFINLPFSSWLFPYNYLNRASYFSYYPGTFSTALHKELRSLPQHAPIFFAVHFALPHWPYAWATSELTEVKDEFSVQEREELYLKSVRGADQQVGRFLADLEKLGYLDNSLVILLSDHGEAFYVPGSRQTSAATYQGSGDSKLADYFTRKTSTVLDMSAGHGSDLLSSSQYRSMLAFKIYKNKKLVNQAAHINTRVALIDIAPTIEQYLGVSTGPLDGVSLFNAITTNTPLPERTFIMESGMLPNIFLSSEKARILGRKYFLVDQDGQVRLRKSELAALDKVKLYAIIQGDWILALYPDDDGYIPVTLRLSDNHWVDNLANPFAQSSPAQAMLKQLSEFYKKIWPLAPNPPPP